MIIIDSYQTYGYQDGYFNIFNKNSPRTLMRQILTLVCLLITIVAISQPKKKLSARDSILVEYHFDSETPIFNPNPVFVFPKSSYGWTKSIDEKWLIKTNILPLYSLSTDRYKLKSNEAKVGLDNYQHMAFYQMTIDSNEFLIYVKQYQTGSYEFPLTKKGWKISNYFYYSIINKPEKTDSIQNLALDSNLYYGFTILDEGLFKDVAEKTYKNPWELISTNMKLEVSDRKLVVQLERKDQGQLRFLIYSIHPIFDDPVGIVSNWKIKNRGIYLDNTLKRLHYTILDKEWSATVLP